LAVFGYFIGKITDKAALTIGIIIKKLYTADMEKV
jgi:hypothetical protein